MSWEWIVIILLWFFVGQQSKDIDKLEAENNWLRCRVSDLEKETKELSELFDNISEEFDKIEEKLNNHQHEETGKAIEYIDDRLNGLEKTIYYPS